MENIQHWLPQIARLIDDDGKNVAVRLAAEAGISRQAASSRLVQAKKIGAIKSSGTGRGVVYELVNKKASQTYQREGLSEDTVWRELCLPFFKGAPPNVLSIWHHGITEMINNAIDHSGSETVQVVIQQNALYSDCRVIDKGEGIFLKIQKALDLYDTREAILELAKGKFTTDPANHSGEGIFFSSKMFDSFVIMSDELSFVHLGNDQPDVLLTSESKKIVGTTVCMRLENASTRTSEEVFNNYALPDEFSFAKTLVPVKLAQHEGERLVSRSQAKRLTRRFERFEHVLLDFDGVTSIGQAFADEVFRVFANSHPKVKLVEMRANEAVAAMIHRVRLEGEAAKLANEKA